MRPDRIALAIDIGSSSLRALGFDGAGNPVPGVAAHQPLQMAFTSDGGACFDPTELLDRLYTCLDRVHAQLQADNRYEVAGIGISTFVSSLLAVSAQNAPLTPLFTYADTRAATVVPSLRNTIDEERVHQQNGVLLHPSYWPAQISWLKGQSPALLAANPGVRWMSIGEWIEAGLFGSARISHSAASWTGFYHRRQQAWDEALIELIGAQRSSFSPIADVSEPQRGLCPAAAKRWPLFAPIPWLPAVGDGAAANLGADAEASGELVLSMGTTSAMRVLLTTPVGQIPPGCWCYQATREIALLGGALTEGGNIYQWFSDHLHLPPVEDLQAQLARQKPAAHGLTILPLLGGERSPGWRGDLRGAILGLAFNTTPLEILQAALESVAYRLALVLDALAPYLPAGSRVIACGKAALQSPAWMQMISDVFGRPVYVLENDEASARGAAILALKHVGLYNPSPARFAAVYQPDDEAHRLHLAAMRQQQSLYQYLARGKSI